MASPSFASPANPAAGPATEQTFCEMLSILAAGPEDAAVIHEIQMRAFAQEGRLSGNLQIPPLTEAVADIELHIRAQTVMVARDGERIIGSARGIVEGSVCTLRGVSVEPSCQGRGIGAALLRAVEQAHPDMERFDLTTNTLVPGNVAFYERRGYEVTALTRYTETIVLAQMSKRQSATGAHPSLRRPLNEHIGRQKSTSAASRHTDGTTVGSAEKLVLSGMAERPD